MPTYEYLCPAGHHFDLIQKMSDKPKARCPKCGKPASRQISGGAGLVFKGSGFYITDYGKDGKGPRKEADAPSKPDNAPKTDAAPAAKAETTSEAKPAAAEKPSPKPATKKAKE
ncbi:MAG: FmdB family zinc ribbon protein [Gemmatimonadales bacterium]